MSVWSMQRKPGSKHRRKEYRASVRAQHRADRRAGREERSLAEARSNAEQFFWYVDNHVVTPHRRPVMQGKAPPDQALMVVVLAVAACVAAAIWWGA